MPFELETEKTIEDETEGVRQQARELYSRSSKAFVGTAVAGLSSVFAVVFYLWRDWKLGYNTHPEWWEALLAGLTGGLIGLGLSTPFAQWFRLQASLVHVQLRMEENTRRTGEQAAATAQSIKEIADAGRTGEWRASELNMPIISGPDSLFPGEHED